MLGQAGTRGTRMCVAIDNGARQEGRGVSHDVDANGRERGRRGRPRKIRWRGEPGEDKKRGRRTMRGMVVNRDGGSPVRGQVGTDAVCGVVLLVIGDDAMANGTNAG